MDEGALRVLVVDDEPLARDRLSRLLTDLPGVLVCGQAEHGAQGVQQAAQLDPDVVLMDIRMPGMDGLEAARHLLQLETPPAVIFTTAFEEHAVEAFGVNAIGYLLKPIRRQALADALATAGRPNRAQLAALRGDAPRARSAIAARTHHGLELVPLSEVRFFRAEQKYVTVRHAGGEVLIDDALRDLEEEFAGRFVRVHRNALAAVAAIEGLDRDADGHHQLRLRDCSESLAVSRRHLPTVRKVMRNL